MEVCSAARRKKLYGNNTVCTVLGVLYCTVLCCIITVAPWHVRGPRPSRLVQLPPKSTLLKMDYHCDCLKQQKRFRSPIMWPRLVDVLWTYNLLKDRNTSRYNSTTGTFHAAHLTRLDEKITNFYLHCSLCPTLFRQPLETRLAVSLSSQKHWYVFYDRVLSQAENHPAIIPPPTTPPIPPLFVPTLIYTIPSTGSS